MKKLLIVVCSFAFLFIPSIVKAASASVKISAPSSVYVGDTVTVNVTLSSSVKIGAWEYFVSYDSSKLDYSSTTAESAQHVINSSDNGKTSVSYSWTFKAKAAGSVTFSINGVDAYAYDDDSSLSIGGSTSATIKINQPNNFSGGGSSNNNKPSQNYKYSENNNLSSLVVEGFEFEFDKNKTDYSISVPNDTKSVKVGATAEDGKAYVNGIGDFEVKEGDNLIEIVVTAENGNKKTYNLNVVVIEATPIEVSVGDKTYNVARKADLLPSVLATYKESTVLIKGEEVPCYHSDITDFYLVGLRNDDGNVELYRYDAKEDKFYTYTQLQLGGIYIALLDGDIPTGYKLDKVKINEKEYSAFVKEGAYPLLYGINLESGEENYYSYDSNEGTIQKLLKSAGTSSSALKSNVIIYGLIGLCVLEFILLICSISSKNRKLKKALKNKLDTKTEYEMSLENNDSLDEVSSDEKIEDSISEESNNDEVDTVADEKYGYTAYVSDSVNDVFSSSKKEKKISKKKKKNDDDEMFQF